MLPSPGLQSFVRDLIGGAAAVRDGNDYLLPSGKRASASDVVPLLRAGAIAGDRRECHAGTETRAWLKRAKIDTAALAAQHRATIRTSEGIEINLAESPLARLAGGVGGDAAFLGRHHVEAGERVRRLVERAHLQPRMTIAYTAVQRVDGASGHNDISDLAADARRELSKIIAGLPRDCAGVVIDVCGFMKGLQEVERERVWPRRSAKLVLRIGLEQLAQQFGLGPYAVGPTSRRNRRWMDAGARPTQLG